MISFTDSNGKVVTAQTATKAQLRYMLEDEHEYTRYLHDELQKAESRVQALLDFCKQVAPYVNLPDEGVGTPKESAIKDAASDISEMSVAFDKATAK